VNRAFGRLADGEVDGAGGAGCERDRDDLGGHHPALTLWIAAVTTAGSLARPTQLTAQI
jgi:hypothetical protein